MDPWANASSANIRFIHDRTSASDEVCRDALLQARGDVMAAVKSLAPDLNCTKYLDLYYLGPFARVSDPDKDLPRRAVSSYGSYARERDDEIESDRNIKGEKFIAPYNDANSIDEIYSGLWIAMVYPDDCWDDQERNVYPTIQGSLVEIADRIRDKLRRNKNPIRAEYFTRALTDVERAKEAYFVGNYSEGEQLLGSCVDSLMSGNKPNRTNK